MANQKREPIQIHLQGFQKSFFRNLKKALAGYFPFQNFWNATLHDELDSKTLGANGIFVINMADQDFSSMAHLLAQFDEAETKTSVLVVLQETVQHGLTGKLFELGVEDCIGIRGLTAVTLAERIVAASYRKIKSDLHEKKIAAHMKFFAKLSHEIRAPLNVIHGTIDLLDEKPDKKEQDQYMDALRGSANLLMALVNDILDLSKMDSGLFSLHPKVFNLEKLAQEIENIVSVQAQTKELIFQVRMDGDLPKDWNGDSQRLTQILINIIYNAIKFTDDGSVTLFISENTEESRKGNILFQVKDTGVGIAPENIEHLFLDYNQFGNPTQMKMGTGLGLAIVKQLVDEMQGEVWVESVEGEGSTFFFTVDLGVVASPSGKKQFLGRKTLLLVDDKEEIREILSDLFESQAIRCLHAEDGLSALEVLRKEEVDAIVSDLGMPKMDGYQLSEEVRKNFFGVPFMILTGAITDEIAQVFDFARIQYFRKPIKDMRAFQDTVLMEINRGFKQRSDRKLLRELEKLGDLQVLLVDDQADSLLCIKAYLKKTHFQVQTVVSGSEALELFKKTEFGIVMVDMNMPGMDGVETIQKLRQMEKQLGRERTIVISLSASNMDFQIKQAKDAGSDFYMAKPFRKEELWKTILSTRLDHFVVEDPIGYDDPSTIDSRYLEELKALERDGNPGFFGSQIQNFLLKSTEYSEKMGEELKAKNYKEVATLAHRLNGVCGFVGALQASGVCQGIEELCYSGKTGRLQKYYDGLNNELESAREILKKHLKDFSSREAS